MSSGHLHDGRKIVRTTVRMQWPVNLLRNRTCLAYLTCLSVGKKQAPKVDSGTQVFEAGALGKTPDGKSLTTYRELCSIANDLNQPDLIYKFMHLANHQAVWNSKKVQLINV